MTYTAYYVPNFPVSKVTMDGRDGWIDIPNHPKRVYGFLEAILEHIDNTNHIDPIRITIHSEGDIQVGPAGTSRFYVLSHLRNHTHVPAIVSTTSYFDWFGENVVKIETEEQIKSYLLLEPQNCCIEPDGKVWWNNQNPNEKQIRETFKVSEATIERILNCL
jgi:hypothetical protein